MMEFNIIPKFVDEAASLPAQAVGNTLANFWNLSVGSHFDLWIKKQEIRQQKNLQDYIEKIEQNTQQIPEEFLKEPDLHIVGPAIEASKYYIADEELRKMFAKLIASSIDIRKTEITHPSFVEIIKQLSSLDANILVNFKKIEDFPISKIQIAKENGTFKVITIHIMNFKNNTNYPAFSSSLSNLQRLGLLNIDYSTNFTDETRYDYIKSHPAYSSAEETLSTTQVNDPTFVKVDYTKGIISRTPLGKDFISICL